MATDDEVAVNLSFKNLIEIPQEVIRRCLDISTLNLSGNQGIILGSCMPRFINVRRLLLADCALRTMPDEICELSQLQELKLERNKFTGGLNPAIGQLRELIKLNLDSCELPNLPDSIGNLVQLQELMLRHNTFASGLNPAIGLLRRLTTLNLMGCELRNLPDSIGDLEQLQELTLTGNKFTSGLNPAIGDLRNLTKLQLGNCRLVNLPDCIGNLKQLQELMLWHNKFTSGLNPAIGQLQRLTKLLLGNCKLVNVPDWIGNLEQLQELMLGYNKFTSGLNPAIGQLRRLTTLNLINCELPNLPDSIENLEQLQELTLSGNKFTGGLNPKIELLRRLTKLELSRCELSNLPDWIGNMDQLKTLVLQSNSVKEYPICTLRLRNLLNIDLSNGSDIDGNRIKNLPVGLAYTNIEYMKLEGNPITEPPKEIWSQGARAVKSFMRAVIPGGELMHADTLNMIGDTGAGKTSVTLSMIENSLKMTEYADRTHVLQQRRLMFDDGLGRCVIINDFGGHDIYHSVMPIFLPANGLIILVCNLVDKSVEEQVKKWMLTALAKSKEFRLILVGTHADQVTDIKAHEYLATGSYQRSALEVRIEGLSSDYLKMAVDEVNANITQLKCRTGEKHVQDKLHALGYLRENLKKATVNVVTLSCSVDDGGLRRLRDVVTTSLRPPHNLPVRWCRFMTNVLNLHADRLYIAMQEVESLGREHFTEEGDRNAITTILRYLVKTSQIIWLENHPFLKDFIFHSPQKIINTCKNIFHHDNVLPTSLTLSEADLNQFSQGFLQERLLRNLLTAQTENHNASEALLHDLFEVVVSFLQQCNLIGFVKETETGKQFIVPCKLTATEPQEMLPEQEEKGSKCLNRVTVRLSFIGSIIPLSLFETSLSSILNVTGDISQHVVCPKVWKDGAIISHNGVTLITKRIDAVICLTAFSEPSFPSPWTILQPVLKRLYENVMTCWHGAPPTCAILCPWCERRKPNNAKVAEIRINLTTLVGEGKPSNDWPTCETCVRAIPRSLCFPIMKSGSFITYQSEIEKFFGFAVVKRKKLLQDDDGPRKVLKQLESELTSKELSLNGGPSCAVSKQLESGNEEPFTELQKQWTKSAGIMKMRLTCDEVQDAADELHQNDHLTAHQWEQISGITKRGRHKVAATAFIDLIYRRGDKTIAACLHYFDSHGVSLADLAQSIRRANT